VCVCVCDVSCELWLLTPQTCWIKETERMMDKFREKMLFKLYSKRELKTKSDSNKGLLLSEVEVNKGSGHFSGKYSC